MTGKEIQADNGAVATGKPCGHEEGFSNWNFRDVRDDEKAFFNWNFTYVR